MIRMYEIQGFSGANTQKMRLGNPNGTGANGVRRRGVRRSAGGALGAGDAAAAAAGRGNQSQREWFRPLAGDRRVRLVAAQQHELRRDRRADGAAVHVGSSRRSSSRTST